jgi:hypothetical protein
MPPELSFGRHKNFCFVHACKDSIPRMALPQVEGVTSMSDEKNLRECLISAFEHLKSQYQTIAEMICDVAALRTVLLEGQTRYKEVFAEEIQKATPVMVSATQVYDDLILALRSGTFWIN